MQELIAKDFVGVFAELRQLIILIDGVSESPEGASGEKTALSDYAKNAMAAHLKKLTEALESINARSALASAHRLDERLKNTFSPITWGEARATLADIESRFADHLEYVQLFTLSAEESGLMISADALIDTKSLFRKGLSG